MRRNLFALSQGLPALIARIVSFMHLASSKRVAAEMAPPANRANRTVFRTLLLVRLNNRAAPAPSAAAICPTSMPAIPNRPAVNPARTPLRFCWYASTTLSLRAASSGPPLRCPIAMMSLATTSCSISATFRIFLSIPCNAMIFPANWCGSLKYLFRTSVPVDTAVALPPNSNEAINKGGPAGVRIVAAAAIPRAPLTIPAVDPPTPSLF
mmetsp:Transcript_1576/g.3480  ORF Transcript_1576/g.3480 Transcript_1576/m.3480 type:complete len:210 (+) Transcript_1576:623-1252(+)